MTEKQINLIQDSWDFIITNTEEAGAIFYNRLFQQSPHLRSLFKEDNREQERKLISLITFAVGKLNDLDQIMYDVQALGTRHKAYGVKEEHYNDVATALLWTIEKALGPRWNEEVKGAWATLYGELSNIMKKAPARI